MEYKLDNELFTLNNLYDFMKSIYTNRENIYFIHSNLYKRKNNYFIEFVGTESLYSLNRIKLKPKDLRTLTWKNYWDDILKQQNKDLVKEYCKKNWKKTINNVNEPYEFNECNISELTFGKFVKFFTYYSIFYLHSL